MLDDPLYAYAWVYGNLIINDWRHPGLSSVKTIHWGGDNSPKYFRRGTLHFYNNTVVVHADRRAHFWYVSLFDMPTREQKVEARANLIYNAGDSELRLAVEHGFIDFKDTNWISAGWQAAAPQATATIAHGGFLLQGKTPELDSHFVPMPSSPAVDQGAPRCCCPDRRSIPNTCASRISSSRLAGLLHADRRARRWTSAPSSGRRAQDEVPLFFDPGAHRGMKAGPTTHDAPSASLTISILETPVGDLHDEEHMIHSLPMSSFDSSHYELRYRSLLDEGHAYAFPCDASGLRRHGLAEREGAPQLLLRTCRRRARILEARHSTQNSAGLIGAGLR